MSVFCRTIALATILAVTFLVPAGIAQAAPPASTADSPFTLSVLFEQLFDWLSRWGNPAGADAGGAESGPGRATDSAVSAVKAGSATPPDDPVVSAAACGDAGTMVDPDGNPCGL